VVVYLAFVSTLVTVSLSANISLFLSECHGRSENSTFSLFESNCQHESHSSNVGI
jgi:hypothetical protein